MATTGDEATARLDAIRYRLTDDWPEGDGICATVGTVGGLPRLEHTRWWVSNWGDQYEQFGELGLTVEEQCREADAAVRQIWGDYWTAAQLQAAREYYLTHRAIFQARQLLHTQDTWALEQVYRADVAYLLDALDTARRRDEARENVMQAARHLGACWEQLCRCVDEFEPDYPQACGEHRDALDTAVEAVIAAFAATGAG